MVDTAELAREVIAARPPLDDTDVHIARTIFGLLVDGHPASVEVIARIAKVEPARVEELLGSRAAVFRDDAGDVIGFWGVTVQEFGSHRMTIDGATTWAWCAWDPMFIAPVTGRTARVTSTCPVTDRTITLTVGPKGVSDVEPSGAVMSFVPPGDELEEDVIATFCHKINYFADREAGERWCASEPGAFVLTLDEGFEVGRAMFS